MSSTRSFSGKHLRELRERAGVTRVDLAFACRRSEQSVMAWERDRMRPRPELLDQIAATLGVERDELFVEAEPARA